MPHGQREGFAAEIAFLKTKKHSFKAKYVRFAEKRFLITETVIEDIYQKQRGTPKKHATSYAAIAAEGKRHAKKYLCASLGSNARTAAFAGLAQKVHMGMAY